MKITENGVSYEIDAETGEILSAEPEAPKFAVTDEKSAEWVLQRIQEEEAAVAALTAQENAILENVRAMKRRHQSKADGLRYRFAGELEAFARENLNGGKTWTCPYGSVQFRKVASRLKVADDSRALEWARTGCPDAVKVTEEFQISKLTDEAKMILKELSADERTARGFEITPETESVSIKTGV